MVALLLAKRADPNHVAKNGASPLLVAAQLGFAKVAKELDMVELLLAASAAVNGARSDGATPLILASQAGHSDVVYKLLEMKADVNLGRSDNGQALMFAAQEGHTDVARQLIAANARADAKADSGATALTLAARNRDEAMLRCLLDADGGDKSIDLDKLFDELHAIELERADIARLHEQVRLENRQQEVTVTRLNHDKELARRAAGELAAELRRVQTLQDTWHDRSEQCQLDMLVMQEQMSDIVQRISSCEESQQKALEEDARLKENWWSANDVFDQRTIPWCPCVFQATEAQAVAALRSRRHQIQSALQQTKVEIASQKRSAEQDWSQARDGLSLCKGGP
eukprot:g31661.t1